MAIIRTIGRSLALTWALQKAAFRSQLEYRLNFVLMMLMAFFYQGSGIAFIWVVLAKFHTLDGWAFRDLAFLYSIRLLAHACWIAPFHSLNEIDLILREGMFDQFLVRPLNPLLQVISSRFRTYALGDIATATALFAIGVKLAHVSFTPAHTMYLVLTVIGGALAEGAFVLAVASLAFRFFETWALRFLVDNVFLMLGSYPMRVFGTTVSWVFTWVVPIAFVAYIPSSALLGRTDGLHVAPVVAWAAPAFGFVWFFVAYRFWCWQLRSYQSSGH